MSYSIEIFMTLTQIFSYTYFFIIFNNKNTQYTTACSIQFPSVITTIVRTHVLEHTHTHT